MYDTIIDCYIIGQAHFTQQCSFALCDVIVIQFHLRRPSTAVTPDCQIPKEVLDAIPTP